MPRAWFLRTFAGSVRVLVALCLMLAQLLFPFGTAMAAPAHTFYSGLVVSVDAPTQLAAGASATVRVTIKNTGQRSWFMDGANYVSIYRYDAGTKKEVPSVFAGTGWRTILQPAKLGAKEVAPGNSALFVFSVTAPSTPGSYDEEFILCAEDIAWIKNTNFRIKLNVPSGTTATAPTTPTAVTVSAPATPIVASTPIPASTEWAATVVDKGGSEWQLELEQLVRAPIRIKNTGTKTWKREGAGYVSLYAVTGNKERQSAFGGPDWVNKTQAAKMKEAEVRPGQEATFDLWLRAPWAPGTYKEEFALAAEKVAWISGSTFIIPINVPMNAQYLAQMPAGIADTKPLTQSGETQPQPIQTGTKYATQLLLRSAQALSLYGSAKQEVTFGFKNLGDVTWKTHSLRMLGLQPALSGPAYTVKDLTWISSVEPTRVDKPTKPGELGFISFRIKAPAKRGQYAVKFALQADGKPVEGGDFELPITVTADGVIEAEPVPPRVIPTTPTPTPRPSPPSTSQTASDVPSLNPIPLNGDVSTLPNEPIIRVGLFKTTDDKMQIRAKFAPLVVTQGGQTVCRVQTGELITVAYSRSSAQYSITGGACNGQGSAWYLVKAEDGSAPMEIADFSRPVGWLPGANDNTFRAQLELRFTPATNEVWIINELPIETYLRGIAETSNISPQEYQRALLTAARTYAMYHVTRGTKHASKFFIVDATYDQVYRGYGQEARSPNIVAAVNATRGQIVTYQGKLAITAYFSRSDGRTRSWTEVWGGGPYPWLTSVPVPWDQGKTLWGHGVGMSATGALGMANDGKRYDEILQWFYRGIELRRAYK